MAKSYWVLINASSGTVKSWDKEELTASIQRSFSRNSLECEIHFLQPTEIVQRCEQAKRSKIDVVVAVGGDGTINAVASQLVGSDVLMGVIPFGTFNLIARDFGIPESIEESIDIISGGNARKLDVAQVGEKIFVNNSLIGAYPQFLQERDKIGYSSKQEKYIAMIRAFFRVCARFPFYRLSLSSGDRTIKLRTPFLHIGVGEFEFRAGVASRSRLENDGYLTVLAARTRGAGATFLLAVREMVGLSSSTDELERHELKQFRLSARGRRKYLDLSLDGEIQRMKTPLSFILLPEALHLLTPVEGSTIK